MTSKPGSADIAIVGPSLSIRASEDFAEVATTMCGGAFSDSPKFSHYPNETKSYRLIIKPAVSQIKCVIKIKVLCTLLIPNFSFQMAEK